MTPEMALALYRTINKGPTVAVDTENNVIHEDTRLGTALEMLGVPFYVSFSHTDPMHQQNGRPRKVYRVAEQVAFLREWADALELSGPDDRGL